MGHAAEQLAPQASPHMASPDEFRIPQPGSGSRGASISEQASSVMSWARQDTREFPCPYQGQNPFRPGQEWVPGSDRRYRGGLP